MSNLPDRLDAALAGHRAPEADTAPLLAVLAQIEPLRSVPPRVPGMVQAGRQAFLAEAVSLQPAPRPAERGRVVAFVHQHRALATGLSVLVVLMMVLTGLSGTAYAAQASNPDDALYPFKLLTEDLRLGLTTDPQARVDTLLEMSQARMAEMTALAKRHQAVPVGVPARLQAQLDAALQAAADLDDALLVPALERMSARIQVQIEAMAQVRRQAPSDGGLEQAARVLTQTQAMIALGLNDPEGFRRAVRSGVQAEPTGERAPLAPTPGVGPGNEPGPHAPQTTPRAQGTGPAAEPTAAGAGGQTPGQGPGPQPSRGPQEPGNGPGSQWAGTPTPGGDASGPGMTGQASHGGRKP